MSAMLPNYSLRGVPGTFLRFLLSFEQNFEKKTDPLSWFKTKWLELNLIDEKPRT